MTGGGVGLIEGLLEIGAIGDIRRTPIHRSAVTSLAEQTTLLSAPSDEAGTVEVITGVRVNTSRRLRCAEQPGPPATGLAGGPPPDPGVAVRSSPRGLSQPTQCLGAVQPAATGRPHECQRGGGRCRHPVRRRTFDRWRNGLRAPRCGRRVPQPDHSDRAPRPPLTPHQPAAGTTPSIDGQLATQEPAPEPSQSAWWFDHCLRSRGGSSRHLMHNPYYPPRGLPGSCCSFKPPPSGRAAEPRTPAGGRRGGWHTRQFCSRALGTPAQFTYPAAAPHASGSPPSAADVLRVDDITAGCARRPERSSPLGPGGGPCPQMRPDAKVVSASAASQHAGISSSRSGERRAHRLSPLTAAPPVGSR